MKLGSPFFIILTITFIVASIGIIIGEFRTNYPEAGVPETSYGNYSYFTEMNQSFGDISAEAAKIKYEEGWWNKVMGTIAASMIIFGALITTVSLLITSIPFFSTIITTAGNALGIPNTILSIAFVAIIGSVVIMIVKFVHKGQS